MSDFLKKIIFRWKKPCFVIIKGIDFSLYFELASVIFRKSALKIRKIDNGKIPLFIKRGETLFFKKEPMELNYLAEYFVIEENCVKIVKNKTPEVLISFGLKEGVDLFVSDINTSPKETNFKVNYQGYIIPFWLAPSLDEQKIKTILAAICFGVIKGVNLVEISQALRGFEILN